MNIIFSSGSKSWGGLEIQTLKLATIFSQKGHKVILLAPLNSTLSNKAKINNINVLEINWSNINTLKNIFILKSVIKDFHPHIIHTQLSHDLWILSFIKPKNSKLILTKRMASSIVKKDFFHKLLYRKVDLILCISNFIKENILKTVPIDEEKTSVLHNGLDTELFNPSNYNKVISKSKYKISKDTLVIGFLGRFTHLKGHKEFFDAGAIVKQHVNNKKVVFLVAGGDSFGEEEFGNNMRIYGINKLGKENIIFTGNIENTAETLSAMDILIFPSHEESFGNVLCEAGAMEIPVIASNSGGVVDIVLENETGLLFEAKNHNNLAEKLIYYIDNENIRLQHGKNARKHIIEKFEIENQLKKLEKIYKDLIN